MTTHPSPDGPRATCTGCWRHKSGALYFDPSCPVHGDAARSASPDPDPTWRRTRENQSERHPDLPDALLYDPMTGDPDFQWMTLDDRLKRLAEHHRSAGFGDGYRAAKEEPAASPDPDLAAALPAHGFAAGRPGGARTRDGHALTTTLRQALPGREVNWDDWVRTIEDQAVDLARSLPAVSPEPSTRTE